MNLALSPEQELLREAARGSLARHRTVEAAHAALDGGALPDLWPTAREAGWPGLLIAEERGGAGLGAFDAMLVAQECGRVLAGVPLVGLLPATAILDAAGAEGLEAVHLPFRVTAGTDSAAGEQTDKLHRVGQLKPHRFPSDLGRARSR